jgi:predicted DNA-binding transcriptional regulator AlpA
MKLKNDNINEEDAPLPDPILVDSRTLANLLDVSPSHLTELRRRYDLPTVYLGGSVRFDVNDVRAWITNHKSIKGRRRR